MTGAITPSAPGVYDFTGVRDVDRALTDAQRAGLYVIARPGPYINAELDAGGFPGWLLTQAGRARSDAPDYLHAVDGWMRAIDRIIARHQFTNGTGTVILDQIENELPVTAPAQSAYMRDLDRPRPRRRDHRAARAQRPRPRWLLGPAELGRPGHCARAAQPVWL